MMKIQRTLTRLLLASCLVFSPLIFAFGCTPDDKVAEQPLASNVENDGSQATDTVAQTSYPLTMKNYGFDGTSYTDEEVVFEQAPTRVFAATQGAAETMLILGLGDSIAGTANKTSEPVAEIAAAYNKLNLVNADYASKEQMLSCDPDMVIGRGALFTDSTYGVGTTAELSQLDISPWILSSSVNGSKMTDIYGDIRSLGKIFDVQDKANAWADELEDRMDALYAKADEAGLASKELSYLFLVQARNGNGYMIFSGPQTSQQEDALKPFGLTNAATEVLMEAVSAENILAFDPDIIFAINYTPGSSTATQTMIDDIKGNESLATLPAVEKDAFYIIEYNDVFSFSFRTVDGVERLMQSLYPDVFK